MIETGNFSTCILGRGEYLSVRSWPGWWVREDHIRKTKLINVMYIRAVLYNIFN